MDGELFERQYVRSIVEDKPDEQVATIFLRGLYPGFGSGVARGVVCQPVDRL